MAKYKFLEELEAVETKYKRLIEMPPSKPKYRLWQVVEHDRGYGKNKETSLGRICGFHFVRVAIALLEGEGCEPGWRYHVETNEDILILQESNIKRVVEEPTQLEREAEDEQPE
ncbi:hypothetical protein NIES2135_53630 [Leptolyngbya boryana NIES-2135]|jgi:hypothetical protein|uniref:Uncharacterized protein n=1 Tax=Leptolyngbya boryana NIES-2135 TaxID=1973484 RepID=A0A1Z4JP58_LEPBY|nr:MULTISPECIES: hypothetical protein [Leptolyngbya]BAY58490.1 hypothetical protein NIES2135_53630 [Leptolyngbya boryana NIES-2135]MBD2370965.1 hypothetical protein [Leptolyngbya sp. FACHB-161]MBD2377479.1 hypothetical protein [Leptolyngbya sp. FACHB-238]MBD2401887.1 hypothetical protein [Leptolyngbya sp. FACHB-239]MBD2408405.1 hypothetical protein [Leptolyngbya sp. FACHB-402]